MNSPEPDPDDVRDGGAEILAASIRAILAHERLSPDEILVRLRADDPGLTLDRVLVALYQNAAVFRRQHGTWCAGNHMSHPGSRMVS